MAPQTSTTLLIIDLVGIFVFGISGALVAVRKGLDVFGVLMLALACGLGGGMVRDVLIGATPPAALRDWRFLTVAVGAGLLVYFFHPYVGRMERIVLVFDAIGLSLFAVAGSLKALDYGMGVLAAILMGVITGVGGGILRDVLAGRAPVVLRGGLYAIPAAAGSAVAVVAIKIGVDNPAASLAGGLVCGGWRLLALWRHWQAPMPQGPASV